MFPQISRRFHTNAKGVLFYRLHRNNYAYIVIKYNIYLHFGNRLYGFNDLPDGMTVTRP